MQGSFTLYQDDKRLNRTNTVKTHLNINFLEKSSFKQFDLILYLI